MSSETNWRVTGQGVGYAPPTSATLDKRLRAADQPGKHLWLVTAGWALADPERPYESTQQLDAENLVILAGPGCYKCEREYSRKLARLPCTGSLELQ
jgi:hypothetical protein